jgi:hypothetical protein
MSLAPLAIRLAETSSAVGGVNHWVVGAIVFVILLSMMLALLAFGAGREHS